jgi:hypothetical protein
MIGSFALATILWTNNAIGPELRIAIRFPDTLTQGGTAMRRYARLGWAITLVAVLGLGAQADAAGKRKRKPDLYVRTAHLQPIGEDHALRGERNVLRFDAETQNRGRGAAKPSKTEIVFVPYGPGSAGGKPIRAFTLDVPRIRGHSPTRYFSRFGEAKSPPLTFNGDPLGAYAAIWCADAKGVVKESNERNNCRAPGNVLQRLYLGKRRWSGTISGTGPVGDLPTAAHEDWASSRAELELERVGLGGVFYYNFNGTVSWAMQGGPDADGCTYSGSGTDSIQGGPANGDFQINYVDGEYTGILTSDLDDTWPVTIQCPTETFDDLGPYFAGFINTAYDGQVRPLPFGTEVLAGSGSNFEATWTWEFR